MDTDQNFLDNELVIDNNAHTQLKETAMWARFLAIMGFIGSGLIAVIAIFSGSVFNSFSDQYNPGRSTSFSTTAGLLIYSIVAIAGFFLSLFLYRFSVKMRFALATTDQELLNGSFQNLKTYFRFAGILTIIYLIAVVLGIVGVIVFAVMSH